MIKKAFLLLCFFLLLKCLFPSLSFATVLEQKTTVTSQETVNQIKIPVQFSTKVSAYIGGWLFNIEGLTSPWAKVSFFSTQGNINLETVADQKGVFRFSKALMPLSSGDFCFISIDTNANGSPPVCFSPPPLQTETNIVGVVLPPSLTIEENVFHQNETISAGGKTSPDSEIGVYLFENKNPPLLELIDVLAPKISAREGPFLTVNSDKNGDFSFNLPSTKSTSWRMFVGTQKSQLGENPSPKSNILQFASLSWWRWFLLSLIIWILKIVNLVVGLFSEPVFIIICLVTAIGLVLYLIKNKQKFNSQTEFLKERRKKTA
jgi:hypothetical protein